MENIMDEIIESYNKNNIDEIIKLVYDKPFNFCLPIQILKQYLKIGIKY